MKKLRPLYLFFLFALTFTACSNDDSPEIVPESEGIKLLFKTSETNNSVLLYVAGVDIVIDWGDGTEEKVSKLEISHIYKDVGKEYTIKIKASALEYFGNVWDSGDLIYFRDSYISSFEEVSLSDNLHIETIAIRQSGVKKINYGKASVEYLYILHHQNDVDVSNILEGATSHLELIVESADNIILNNSSIHISSLNIYLQKDIKINSVEISLPDLQSFNLTASALIAFDESKYIKTEIGSLILGDISELKSVNIRNLKIKSFDMIKAEYLSTLYMEDVDIVAPLKFSKGLDQVYICSFHLDPPFSQFEMKEMDFSLCSNLEKLSLFNIPNLSQLNLDNCDKLKMIEFGTLPKLSKIDLSGLSNLEDAYVSYYSDSYEFIPAEGNISEINISDCSNLRELHVLDNVGLQNIVVANNTYLKTLNLRNAKLSESALLTLLASLDDTLWMNLSDFYRELTISGNPGLTSTVEEKASKMKHWKID